MRDRHELMPLTALVLAAAILCACESASICDVDAGGVLPTRVTVRDGEECVTRSLSIPRRDMLTCGDLPDDFIGSRVTLEGHPGAVWRVTVDRMDGTPNAFCAAVLDQSCQCVLGQCTANAAERLLILDLGQVDEPSVEVLIGAGTYYVELCSF